jgi:hypothetical protein
LSDKILLQIDPGTTFTITVTYTDSNGAPVNLTGYTYAWYVNVIGGNTYTGAPEVVPASDLTTGVITLTLSATETAAFTRVRGYHYLRVTSPAGVVTDLIEGAVDVSYCGF